MNGDVAPSSASVEHRRRAHARQHGADRRAASRSWRSSSRSAAAALRRRRTASARAARPGRAAPRPRRAPPISTACEDSSVPISRSPLALAVEPVETRSTIASASPSRGVASTDPETGTSSAATPRSSSSMLGRNGIGGRDAEAVEVLDRRSAARRSGTAACSVQRAKPSSASVRTSPAPRRPGSRR